MRMFSTSSLISYPVGVQILNATPEKYLFRSLLTTQRTPSGVLFALTGALVASKLTLRAKRRGIRFAFAARRFVGEAFRLPPFAKIGFREGRPLPYSRGLSERITERSGVTLVPAPISCKSLAIPPTLCYTNHRKAVGR